MAFSAAGGSGSQPSLLEIQAAVDDATDQLAQATALSERLGFDISRLESERLDAQQRVDVALARLHESDATLAAVAEQLGQFGSQVRSARAEAERLDTAVGNAEIARDQDLAGLADLEQRLTAAEAAPDEEPDTSELERLAEAARAARGREMEGRLALRTSEERGRALQGRADSLLAAARAEREARARAAERRERRRREGQAAEAVGAGVSVVLARLEVSVHLAAEERTAVEATRRDREQELVATRARLRQLGAEHDELVRLRAPRRDGAHRAEDAHRADRAARPRRARPRHRRARGGLRAGATGAGLRSRSTRTVALPDPTPYVREEQQKRLRTAERSLAMLGRVNPLALEEFSAMEERHKFLTEQLEDLKKTRKDLLDIVREVDARVEQVFTEAYADVSVAFDSTFTRLFPGGEGRLVLTDPDDMLNTGIEVEARPAGKRVKRLSLLSGGERSLVAVAFLVALFKARPSPFYILDEVEAALDDTNLGRLLEIYEELRENSQLLVITHQKRTMEVADALYGVIDARRRRLGRDQPKAAGG